MLHTALWSPSLPLVLNELDKLWVTAFAKQFIFFEAGMTDICQTFSETDSGYCHAYRRPIHLFVFRNVMQTIFTHLPSHRSADIPTRLCFEIHVSGLAPGRRRLCGVTKQLSRRRRPWRCFRPHSSPPPAAVGPPQSRPASALGAAPDVINNDARPDPPLA